MPSALRVKVHGQIAHIDRNPTHNDAENLAYLCLEHANLYDVVSKQSKGFTPGELRKYKAALLLLLQAVYDPHHLRRRIADENRRSAAKIGKKKRQRRPSDASRRRRKE